MEKKTGVDLIAAERQRQITEEGYDVINDEGYSCMELSSAAGCYLANAMNKWTFENTEIDKEVNTRFQVITNGDPARWVDGWPWDAVYDKRRKHDVKRSLVIAGALIAAQLDRLLKEELDDSEYPDSM